ncbi:uncharacterized protein LOC110714914 [Chenopodium quinoa]|uniref:Uncharacterized protein n=1 Tax=Chenopodium quinoa TaxID=63459 RepID=A0A803LZJ3_CHEQI|nr:uncharacterized protein LOC110714914 [Chenopodium quinoa]
MEARTQSSRKRKQSSFSSSSAAANSNPFSGILTRHKSQKFFFHHNRSGKSRRSRSFPSSLTNPKLPNNQRLLDCNVRDVGVEEDDSICQISIKDLRARRVFSKPVGVDSVGKIRDDKTGKSVNPNFDSELNAGKSDGNGKNPSLLVMGKCDSGVEFKGEGLNGENPNLVMLNNYDNSGAELKVNSNGGNPNLSMLDKCVESNGENLNGGNPNLSMLDKCVESNGENLNGGNPNLSIEGIGAKNDCVARVSNDMSPNLSKKDLNGEHCEEGVQTTPPDAAVLIRQSEDQSVLRSRSSDSRSPPKKISPSKGGFAEGKRSFPNSKRNLGLTPCSRLKVFKAPNSFSYKRLLPFLMDLSKDTPNAPKVNPSIKVEKVEDKPLIFSSQENVIDCPKLDEKPVAAAVCCESPEMNVDGKEEVLLDLKTNVSDPQQAAPCTPDSCSIEKVQETPVFDKIQIENPVSDDPKNGGASFDSQVSNMGKSGDISPIVESDLAVTLHSPKRSAEPLGEEAVLNTPSHLSLSSEQECRTVHTESNSVGNPVNVLNNSSTLEAVVSPSVPSSGQANGILKRNPRGCRGICNCLNCASFRLNAEKAFEFSRNQWLDAEELAMDLMKELSNLRSILEKSVNGSDANAVVPVDQVQEACRRASHAEDTARSRIDQMSEDLHVHCRTKPLQRPGVNFSSSVQEKKDHRSLGGRTFARCRKVSMRILD